MDKLFVPLQIAAGIGLVYAFLTKPRLSRKKEMLRWNQVYYAHRGLHNNAKKAPENSMRAFKKAIRNGYGIELDVQLTKDFVPVVFHDQSLFRACGENREIKDLNYWELKHYHLFKSDARIPKFSEVLELVNGQVPLIVEFKRGFEEKKLCELSMELLREYKGSYVVESFSPGIVAWFRKHEPQILRGQLSDNFFRKKHRENKFLLFLSKNLLLNWIGRPDFIAYNHEYKNNFGLRFCRKIYGAPMAAWTIMNENELQENQRDFDLMIFEGFKPQQGKTDCSAEKEMRRI